MISIGFLAIESTVIQIYPYNTWGVGGWEWWWEYSNPNYITETSFRTIVSCRIVSVHAIHILNMSKSWSKQFLIAFTRCANVHYMCHISVFPLSATSYSHISPSLVCWKYTTSWNEFMFCLLNMQLSNTLEQHWTMNTLITRVK